MTADWFPAPKVPPLRGGPVPRWGVLGPGTIANDFTTAIHRYTDQRVVAVASRSPAWFATSMIRTARHHRVRGGIFLAGAALIAALAHRR